MGPYEVIKELQKTGETMKGNHGYGLFIVRLVLGIIFVIHGAHKIFGWPTGALGPGGLTNTVAGMTQMGMPALVVYLVMFTEFLGGIALIFGLLSRLAAFGILCVMLGAIFMVHFKNGFFINWYLAEGVKHGLEYNLALSGMALGIIFGGPGSIALDNVLRQP